MKYLRPVSISELMETRKKKTKNLKTKTKDGKDAFDELHEELSFFPFFLALKSHFS